MEGRAVGEKLTFMEFSSPFLNHMLNSHYIVLQAIALMYQGQVVALDASIAVSAAKLGFDLKLPLADSVILAAAKAQNALIWTQDSDFKDIEGVKYIPWKKK
jgi:predicted nucleic acid-binding protein